MGESTLIMGSSVTGRAVSQVLDSLGETYLVLDDNETFVAERKEYFRDIRLTPVNESELKVLVDKFDRVVVSPGVPISHPIFEASFKAGVEIVSEIELGFGITNNPIIAITGTNGKTTITSLVTEMLVKSGIAAKSCGNIGDAFVTVAFENRFVEGVVLVVEVSSFQLKLTKSFRPNVALWCNFSEDHLDWHPNIEDYFMSKTKIWENQSQGDIAIANFDDVSVMKAFEKVTSPTKFTYGVSSGDYCFSNDGVLQGPNYGEIVSIRTLKRKFPTDLSNFAAATAVALNAGAKAESISEVLSSFEGLKHRVEVVKEASGVTWIDDSKATTPVATLAALDGREHVILIAGGKNKGLDFNVLRSAKDSIDCVIAIGESGNEVKSCFPDKEVYEASSMLDAVKYAYNVAKDSNTVLLSPGGASFDWYDNYKERGDDFRKCVEMVYGSASC